jgi:hypothetical protein
MISSNALPRTTYDGTPLAARHRRNTAHARAHTTVTRCQQARHRTRQMSEQILHVIVRYARARVDVE